MKVLKLVWWLVSFLVTLSCMDGLSECRRITCAVVRRIITQILIWVVSFSPFHKKKNKRVSAGELKWAINFKEEPKKEDISDRLHKDALKSLKVESVIELVSETPPTTTTMAAAAAAAKSEKEGTCSSTHKIFLLPTSDQDNISTATTSTISMTCPPPSSSLPLTDKDEVKILSRRAQKKLILKENRIKKKKEMKKNNNLQREKKENKEEGVVGKSQEGQQPPDALKGSWGIHASLQEVNNNTNNNEGVIPFCMANGNDFIRRGTEKGNQHADTVILQRNGGGGIRHHQYHHQLASFIKFMQEAAPPLQEALRSERTGTGSEGCIYQNLADLYPKKFERHGHVVVINQFTYGLTLDAHLNTIIAKCFALSFSCSRNNNNNKNAKKRGKKSKEEKEGGETRTEVNGNLRTREKKKNHGEVSAVFQKGMQVDVVLYDPVGITGELRQPALQVLYKDQEKCYYFSRVEAPRVLEKKWTQSALITQESTEKKYETGSEEVDEQSAKKEDGGEPQHFPPHPQQQRQQEQLKQEGGGELQERILFPATIINHNLTTGADNTEMDRKKHPTSVAHHLPSTPITRQSSFLSLPTPKHFEQMEGAGGAKSEEEEEEEREKNTNKLTSEEREMDGDAFTFFSTFSEREEDKEGKEELKVEMLQEEEEEERMVETKRGIQANLPSFDPRNFCIPSREALQSLIKSYISPSFTFTTHVENGITYGMDVRRVMFSSGNTTERMRFAHSDAKEEEVVDMFCGIGYFTLPLAVHGKPRVIHAIDKNPDSVAFMRMNAVWNGVGHIVDPHCGDNREVGDEWIGKCDRVIMGYLPSCKEHLLRAVMFLKHLPNCSNRHGRVAVEKRDEDEQERGQEKGAARTFSRSHSLVSLFQEGPRPILYSRPTGIIHYHFLSEAHSNPAETLWAHLREELGEELLRHSEDEDDAEEGDHPIITMTTTTDNHNEKNRVGGTSFYNDKAEDLTGDTLNNDCLEDHHKNPHCTINPHPHEHHLYHHSGKTKRVTILDLRRVKSYAPNVFHYVADVHFS